MSPAVTDALTERIGRIASVMPELQLIVLFGSTARGRAGTQSDVDVAVSTDATADLDALYLALAPAFRTDRLDIVNLRRAGPLLAFDIARSGVVLFERSPGIYRQFQSLAQRKYADTKKLRDAQRRAIQVFLALEHRA
ncbi:MAG: type VII toxin-antitoxin system MntA family adenylyltransferase antitoxin [Vicinamibacterales bacterium]